MHRRPLVFRPHDISRGSPGLLSRLGETCVPELENRLVNYFAHALPWLDRPEFLAGLAVPDWLSVVDRKVRVRERAIRERWSELHGPDREIAAGILQHLEDDRWFHGTPAFFESVGRLGGRFRSILGEGDGWKCGFLGHVILEVLIDAVLIEQQPDELERYYNTIAAVDGVRVERTVAGLSTRAPNHLATFVDLYRRERFLQDYVDNDRLLFRMNQVMRRVALEPLPAEVQEVFDFGRDWIRPRLTDLLPPGR